MNPSNEYQKVSLLKKSYIAVRIILLMFAALITYINHDWIAGLLNNAL